MKTAIWLLTCCALLAGCDADRIAKLEKENADLKAKVEKQSATENFELQAKCSKDARAWFNLNFRTNPKTTLYLDFTNHYNKSSNTCLILVEYHIQITNNNWHTMLSLWNVYENSQYGKYDEGHSSVGDLSRITDNVYDCEVGGLKCTSMDGFNKLVSSYMND